MRWLITILVACLLVGANAVAQPGAETVTVSIGTNATMAVTSHVYGVWGELVQIEIDETVAGADVDIDITAHPTITTITGITIYSADDVTADTMLYPAIDRTGSDGVALTNDPPSTYFCAGDELRVVVSDWNTTNLTMSVRFIWK